MTSLDQYLDLYRQHSGLVASGSCEVMNKLRDDAFSRLEKMKLPAKGSENYEVTDFEEILKPDFGLNLSRILIDSNPAGAFHCGVPTLATQPVFQINDITSGISTPATMPEGVTVSGLKEFCEKNPEIAEKYYGRLADLDNPLVALDTLLAQDGIAIHVKKGVRTQIPLQIVNLLSNGAPLMAVRRLLIIMEDDSELKILSCDHTQNSSVDFLNLQVAEIFAGERSVLDFYELEESSEKTSRLSALYLRQEKESNVLIDGITLYNGTTRNEYFTQFIGEEARLKLMGMGIEDKHRSLDTFSKIDHIADKCFTDELFKYVVDEEAVGGFSGLIKVAQGATKTEAYQSNRNIVGSETARMYSKPQLEIYDDDVKCSHGCAIGQLDEKQVFYMQTRGIPELEAKFLLKQAFMADVVEAVRVEGLRERLHTLVEKRFAGELSQCSFCGEGKCMPH